LPQFGRGNLQDLRFRGFAPCGGDRGSAHQHGNVANKIPRARGAENLFDSLPRFVNFNLAAQADDHGEIPLSGTEEDVTTIDGAARPQWVQQRELVVVQLGKSNALRVTVK